ncbi:PAN domain-containing protein [Phthorimaea operculella]|nr:PAN domain-containing protein [Phthorimaea operculella]
MKPRGRIMHAFTALTMLTMANAQTTCNQGMGRVMYERLPNQQLHGFDDDVVRDTAPPFRVLEKCQDLCLRDRSGNSLVRTCQSIDFQPGARIAAFSPEPEYEESTCYLTREQAMPEGIGTLMIVPNSVHFNEICLTSNRPERECPSRRYVFERHARKRLKLPPSDLKEIMVANRTECEDKCLGEFSFVCRSATFDSQLRTCSLSRFTRRTHPELLEDDHNADYLENTCLNAERRCDGLAVFIKEENKRLGGPFEADVFSNMTLDECQSMCVRAEKYFCRSIEHDAMTKQCVLSEEDSVSQKDDVTVSASPTHHFYDLVCLDNPRGTEYPDNSVTSHLFSPGRRPDTAFQRYRNSRITGEFHSEITGRSLSECLDECLRQTSFQCRSAVYSDRARTCRLSRYNQKDGMRLLYDPDFDYYENLMHQLVSGEGEAGAAGGSRPGGSTDRYPDDDRYDDDRYGRPDRYPDDRYPAGPDPYDRYPSDRYPDDRYPPGVGLDRYPIDRYPPGADRYPERFPIGGGRYPIGPGGDRYPLDSGRYPAYDYPSNDIGRYPAADRYPIDRYPASDRYPVSRYPIDVYPERYPAPVDRYPPPADRYPPPADRYPAPADRYPADRYPIGGGGRYPARPYYPSRYPDRYDQDRYPGTSGYPGTSDWGRYPYSRYPVGVNRDPLPLGGDRYPDLYNKYPPTGSSYPGNLAGYGRGGYYGGSDYPGPERYPISPIPDRGLRPGLAPGPERYPVEPRPSFGLRPNRPVLPAVPVLPERPGGYRGNYPPPGLDRPIGGAPIGGAIGPGYGGYDDGPIPPVGPGGPGLGRPPVGTRPWQGSRCEEDSFRQVGRQRMQRRFVRRFTTAQSLAHCQRECIEARDFICRSFNFREVGGYAGGEPRDNCELSDRDTRELDAANPAHFDNTANEYDFYERALGRIADDCLDVSQVCNEDGMEFTLRLPEGFYGRMYTYGFYDRCFFRGNGGTQNVLRISGAHGYPECGTQRYGDTMTNIVVVQFSDNVQTSRDKRFNLTCLFRGPAEAVVTSNYIGAGSGSPIPIEYLPEESSLNQKVRLMILYQGRPTTTIAVGDPLTFRLEAQDGYNYATDIFATNVIARDPYSGRSVQLIDRVGCPVDPDVFPELDKGRNGDSLEARFNAFKIPESNFLVFEATVRTCRDGCQPAYCPSHTGRSEPSFGRRRRDVNSTLAAEANDTTTVTSEDVANTNKSEDKSDATVYKVSYEEAEVDKYLKSDVETPSHVRKMIEVFDNRNELLEENGPADSAPVVAAAGVCVSPYHYRALLVALCVLLSLLLAMLTAALYIYRRYWRVLKKNIHASSPPPALRPVTPGPRPTRPSLFAASHLHKPFSLSGLGRTFAEVDEAGSAGRLASAFDDGSEPIYTDPSLFERSRSLRSLHSLDLKPERRDHRA